MQDVSERKIRFTTIHSAKEDILNRMEDLVKEMGFLVHKKEGRVSNFLNVFFTFRIDIGSRVVEN